MKKVGFVLLLLTILLAGCGGADETPIPSPSSSVSPLTQSSPVQPPSLGSGPPVVAPPASGLGSAVGRLLDYETGQATTQELPLYLGTLVPMEPGDTFVISMSPTNAPMTLMNVDGYFVFSDIEPGTYALVFWTPMSTWVFSNSETQESVVITFEANQITELGEIIVDLPNF